MTKRTDAAIKTIPVWMAAAWLASVSPVSAEECAAPCTTSGVIDPSFVVNDTTSGATDWAMGSFLEGGLLAIGPPGSSLGSITIEDGTAGMLYLDGGAGRIGVATTAPAKRLHLFTSVVGDGIRINNTVGAFTTTWDFAVDAFAGLNIRDVETGTSVMRLREGAPSDSLVISSSGNVGLGTASPTATLHVAGSGRIDGDVSLGSSRTLKTAFGSVNPAELLARVGDLPVGSWRYKTENEEVRHIGPFAEDFQRLFGLGDGKTISIIDAQGVILAAIQGLQQELAAKDADVAALRSHNAELESRLVALEGRLEEQ